MKKLIACAAVAFTVVASVVTLESVSGCKSIPTTDGMYRTSYAVGVATAMVMNNTKIDDTTRNTIIDILNEVRYCVPETNQTFEVAWMEKAQAYLADLVKNEKLTQAQADLIEVAFRTVCRGLDYLFEHRYPSAKQYKEITVAAIDGFSDGFLLVFKPANTNSLSCIKVEFDVEAYNYLKAQQSQQ